MGQHSSILITLAGISLFMYGMTLASDNLQKLAANRIRDLINVLSQKHYLGIFVGILLTALIQSSGAVTTMLVGLGTARVVTLSQVMGVILGTAIGTTITVQLLSLNIAELGLPIFTAAFIIYFLNSKRDVKRTMSVLMGFGLLFWGLELIGIGTANLKQAAVFADSIAYLKSHPILAILITAAFTAVVHSSAATIGLAMSFASAGFIDLTDTIYWVYGANVGTTATALLASAGSNYIGRQVAWAHCFFKTTGVVIFFYFTEYLVKFVESGALERDIANAHTVFNVLSALAFYPFIDKGAFLITKVFPRPQGEAEFSVQFIDRGTLDSNSIVIAQAERETLRMGDIVNTMVKDSMRLFVNQNLELNSDIRDRDNKVDILNKEISLFLTKYMDNSDSHTHNEMIRILSFATDLETAADVIDNSLLDLAEKKHHLKLEFSDEGWAELKDMHRKVIEVCTLSLSCFQTRDSKLAAQIVSNKRSIRKLEKQFRESHIQRLVKGRRESINTSSIHLDALNDYRRIVGILSNHVYPLLTDSDKYDLLPRRGAE